MRERTPCAVPGCRRTAPRTDEDDEIICGKHARLAPAVTRRRARLLQRRLEAFMEKHPDPFSLPPELLTKAARLLRGERLSWRVLKARVIRATAGL